MVPDALVETQRDGALLPPSSIRTMRDVLTWHGEDIDQVAVIHESWSALASWALGETLERLRLSSPSASVSLTLLIEALPEDAYRRLVTAPETTFRLLPGRLARLEETSEFLRQSAWAEHALVAQAGLLDEEVWTALGDARVSTDGTVHLGTQVDGLMPLDFDSPHSRSIDLSGDQYRVPYARPPMGGDDLHLTLAMLERVRDGLAQTSPFLLRFCVLLTKVLILQKEESQPFSSGSNGDFVGRSVISNPHQVGDTVLADAIVHEAIHALLYMQEEQQRWVLDEELYEPIPRVISPWSNRHLPLRPFLQACFVWYGLANFWALARVQDSFEASSALALFRRAATGFLRGSLVAKIEAYRSQLTEDIIETIDAMQARMVAALSEHGA